MTDDNHAVINTDRELWRECCDDYYSDSLHVTEGGGIGINCGGHVIVQSLRQWHQLAAHVAALSAENRSLKERLACAPEETKKEAARSASPQS